ncbi:hypothetical protein OROMI_012624 [Orobanche minor]
MKIPSNGFLGSNSGEGEKKVMNSELWHACAGPLVSLPQIGSLVVYFPQGHSEQIAASMQKEADTIPSYPNLPSKLICMLHNVTSHADGETDEVYAQMTLQPASKYDQEALLVSDVGLKQNRQPAEFFCKTLTASDTSTHGGFSVPRRAAEKIFPPLDFSMQPPCQELAARDLHDQTWTFRHIYRGQPKRHLLTTGWSVFVSSKRLVAGDTVLFIRDGKSQLLLGIRRANRQQPPLSSSVISSDSMHIGILAAAAHAAANNSPFTIFYNPRAGPSEFVIPLAKYNKAMYKQVSSGMRFRMMFETEESSVRRYMGTVTSISDLDPVRWKNSQWRNLQVGWDESTAGERPSRISIWEIEPVVTPFYICPPSFFRPKFPKHPGLGDEDSDIENIFKRGMPWLADDLGLKDSSSSLFPGLSLVQWMNMQQQNNHNQSGFLQNMVPSIALQGNLGTIEDPSKLLSFQSPVLSAQNNHSNKANLQNNQQVDQLMLPKISSWPQQPEMLQSPTITQHLQQHQQFPMHQPQPQILQRTQTQSMPSPPTTCGLTTSQHMQQNDIPASRITFPMMAMNQDLPYQQKVEHQQIQSQQSLTQRPTVQQTTQHSVAEQQQLQLQLLQKLHQQQKHQQLQVPSQLNPLVESQLPPQNQQAQQDLQAQHLSLRPHQLSGNQFQRQQKTPQVLQTNFLKNQTGPPALLDNTFVHLSNVVQESHAKVDARIKHKMTAVDHIDATSSSTSYCLEADGVLQPNFSMNGLDGDAQSHTENGIPFTAGMDGLEPDALLSRGYGSGKDIQNLLSNYGGAPRDIEADLSSGINSQSFGVPKMSFKPGCSNDAHINETGFLDGGGMWPSQTQRMRTYTKVQKRGSVGRTIDVTRYKGYDELRHDLARMFGIEGLLEDPQRTEWKLVYVDHENDILLVGDDPWEEFVSCVQSIKILSSSEVHQMSLDGDLSQQLPVPNQACSGTDSGNAWRVRYDDNSATSFN